jgi:hypothetical protein
MIGESHPQASLEAATLLEQSANLPVNKAVGIMMYDAYPQKFSM